MASVERIGEAIYFTDDEGKRWRVHDTRFEGGKHVPVAHGDLRARYRVWVPPDRTAMLRVYDFRVDGSSRELTPNVLAAQLRASAYTPRDRPKRGPEPPGTPLGQ